MKGYLARNRARARRRRRRGYVGRSLSATCYHPLRSRIRFPWGGQRCGVCGAITVRAGYMAPTTYKGAA